jgi:hypothetical protein
VWDFLNPLMSFSEDLVVLATIGNPEAKTYNTDLNARLGIFFMMIALAALIIMIAFRAKGAQEEAQPSHVGTSSSSKWVATAAFMVGGVSPFSVLSLW